RELHVPVALGEMGCRLKCELVQRKWPDPRWWSCEHDRADCPARGLGEQQPVGVAIGRAAARERPRKPGARERAAGGHEGGVMDLGAVTGARDSASASTDESCPRVKAAAADSAIS